VAQALGTQGTEGIPFLPLLEEEVAVVEVEDIVQEHNPYNYHIYSLSGNRPL
jgi:hypothetical protein